MSGARTVRGERISLVTPDASVQGHRHSHSLARVGDTDTVTCDDGTQVTIIIIDGAGLGASFIRGANSVVCNGNGAQR